MQRLPSCPARNYHRHNGAAVVDKPAKHARRAFAMRLQALALSRPAITPGGTTAATKFAGDEQAGWAAGVDWRRNAQGCPGWRGWRSRWRRSRSICGASRRQGRHRARRRLGACRRLIGGLVTGEVTIWRLHDRQKTALAKVPLRLEPRAVTAAPAADAAKEKRRTSRKSKDNFPRPRRSFNVLRCHTNDQEPLRARFPLTWSS